MGLIKDLKYSYHDIAIKPAVISDISHREECNPFDDNKMLPLFTAPMSSVVNEKNFDIYRLCPKFVAHDHRLQRGDNQGTDS